MIETRRTGTGIWDSGEDKSVELREGATKFFKLLLFRIK
jgi:hypothetical protein